MVFHVRDSVSIVKIPPNFWSFDRGGDRLIVGRANEKHGRLIPYGRTCDGAFKPRRIKGRRSKSFPRERNTSNIEGEGSRVHRLWNKLVVCCWKITGIAKEGKEEAPRRLDAGLPLLYRRLLASLSSPTFSSPVYISLSIVFPWWPVTSHFARTVS